jgi:hypothetical protein
MGRNRGTAQQKHERSLMLRQHFNKMKALINNKQKTSKRKKTRNGRVEQETV